MRRCHLLLVAAMMTGAVACTSEASYFYRPTELTSATLAGHPAARYDVPPESPRGTVRVASFGIAGIETSSGTVPALHVRLRIANNNDTGPWEIDAHAIQVVYQDGHAVTPWFVNTSARDASRVEIAPGGAFSIDAYFALPPGVESAAQLGRFDVIWRVRTPEREVAERTPFERIRVEPEVTVQPEYRLGLWGAWWYNPLLLPGPPVIIERRPRVFIMSPHRR